LLLRIDWGSSTFLAFLLFVVDGLLLVDLGDVVSISALDSLVLLKSPSIGSSLSLN